MPNKPKQKTIETPEKYLGEMGVLYTPFIPFENFYSTDTAIWRYISRKQPIIMDCITTIIMRIQALPWAIRAKDANDADELKEKINEHQRIIREFGGIGFLNAIDLLLSDYYMSPFGTAIEPVRFSDGRLYKISQPIDAATLFPTSNPNFPVIQRVGANEPVAYKKDEIVRLYTPRPELERRGWGYATVEKVYLAVELLARGDKYYAQLLLDTPEAGLLDLGDMSKESAEKWLESFRSVMSGIDPFKIPVIYQHNKDAKWIPFGRPPTDLLFDQVTFKYAQLVCAVFGLTTGDIGLRGPGGGGLSGQIRDERHSRSTGFASIKAKLVEFFNQILPDDLEFMFVDTDDELLVAKGRARSANAVAGRNLIEAGALTPKEWRKQLIADGLITIPLDEEPDEEDFEILKEIDGTADQLEIQEKQLEMQQKISQQRQPNVGTNQGGKGLNRQRNVRGGKLENVQGKEPVPASEGGQGEIKSKLVNYLIRSFAEVENEINLPRARRLIKQALKLSFESFSVAKDNQDYDVWKSEYITDLFESSHHNENLLKMFSTAIQTDNWWKVDFDHSELADILEDIYKNGVKKSAQDAHTQLYENGLADSPYLEQDVEVETDLYEYAIELSNHINEISEYYIHRLAFAVVADGFDEIVESDLDKVLESDIINILADRFINNFNEIIKVRVENIDKIESKKIFDSGYNSQKGNE